MSHTIHDDGILPAHVVIHPAPEPEPVRRNPDVTNQTIITLSDGQQIAIFGADLTDANIMHRNSSGGMWSPGLHRGAPHGKPARPTVHHGSW